MAERGERRGRKVAYRDGKPVDDDVIRAAQEVRHSWLRAVHDTASVALPANITDVNGNFVGIRCLKCFVRPNRRIAQRYDDGFTACVFQHEARKMCRSQLIWRG